MRSPGLNSRLNWDHVFEEIEDVGLSELNAVRSCLRQMLAHLLKLVGGPNSAARKHWRSELVAFQADAGQRYAPSLRQRIDIQKIYEIALQQAEPLMPRGKRRPPLPSACPVTHEQSLSLSIPELEVVFARATTHE